MKKVLTALFSIFICATIFISCSDEGSSDINTQEEAETIQNYNVIFRANFPKEELPAGKVYYWDFGGCYYTSDDYDMDRSYFYEKNTEITLTNLSKSKYEIRTIIKPPYCYYDSKTYETEAYNIESWNTEADGSGIRYEIGTKYIVTKDTEFFAQYKNPNETDDKEEEAEDTDENVLYIENTTEFSMKVGEIVKLMTLSGGYGYYSVASDDFNAISLDDKSLTITALTTGQALVYLQTAGSAKYYCLITVQADGEESSILDEKLVGRWENGQSYIILNKDKTGRLEIYQNGKRMNSGTFTWSAKTISENLHADYYYLRNYLSFSNSSEGSNLNQDYELFFDSDSDKKITLKGYLAIFYPRETNWTKQ